MEIITELGRKIWIVLGAGVLIFGSVWSLFESLDKLFNYNIVRVIFIVVFFLFFVLLLFVYDLMQRRNEVAKKFGFRINKEETESNIKIDSSAVLTKKFELEVIGPELDSIEHRSIVFGQNKISQFSIDVSGDAEGCKISHRITHQSDKSVIFVVEFSPSLKKNKKAIYTIKEEYGPGLFAMDKDYILNMIKNNEWLYNEPYEGNSEKISYPTDKIVKKVILPKNYNISGKEYWEVTIGDSNSIPLGEYKRIKSEEQKFFRCSYLETGMVLELTVDKPEIGLSYGIKWIPPPKEEYEKCLEDSKDK